MNCPLSSPGAALSSLLLHAQDSGFCFDLHHLRWTAGKTQPWSKWLKPQHLHFVFNLKGEGLVIAPSTRLTLLPKSLAVFSTPAQREAVVATRFASSRPQESVLLSLPQEAVAHSFRSLYQLVQKNLGVIRRWGPREERFYEEVLSPPIEGPGRKTWYLAKILEMTSLHLFAPVAAEAPLFCTVIKTKAKRYVQEALDLLQARLAEPFDLTALAADVGCTAPYLSRLVKQETGHTLSHHLRVFRIDQAAALLAGNQLNVTETALEVGYQSLSHFSKAFAAQRGLSPSEFLKRAS